MLRNVLRADVPNVVGLKHIFLKTGRKHYLGPFELLGSVAGHELPRGHKQAPLPKPLLCPRRYIDGGIGQGKGEGKNISWSVHRPDIIFGFSLSGGMSLVGSLCVSAAICKKLARPMKFPGTRVPWEGSRTRRMQIGSDCGARVMVARTREGIGVQLFQRGCVQGEAAVEVAGGAVGSRGGRVQQRRFSVGEVMAGMEGVLEEIVRGW